MMRHANKRSVATVNLFYNSTMSQIALRLQVCGAKARPAKIRDGFYHSSTRDELI